MKKIFLLTVGIMLFSFIPGLGAEELRIKIAVVDFKGLTGYEDGESEQITELLKGRLINNARFSVIDTDALGAETLARYSGCVDFNCAMEIGKLLETDYVLVGSIGKVGQKEESVLTVLLANVISEKKIFSEEEKIDQNRSIQEVLDKLSEKISSTAVLITKVTLQDIRGYMFREQYLEADRYLKFYIDRHGENGDTDELRLIINREIAAIRYKESRELLSNYMFDDARTLINEAILLEPDNTMYEEHLELIERGAEEYRDVQDEDLLNEINRLIEDQSYRGARALLTIYTERGGDENSQYQKYKNIVQDRISAEEHYKQAQRHLEKKRYDDARVSINSALQLRPEYLEYKKFLEQMEEEEAREKRSRETWQSYKSQIMGIDYMGALLVRKNIRNFTNLAYATHFFTYRDSTTLDRTVFRFNGIEGSFMYHILQPFELPLSFTSFHLTAFGSISFGRSAHESDGTLSTDSGTAASVILKQDNFFYADLNGGAMLTAVFFAYFIGIGAELSFGFLNMADIWEVLDYQTKRRFDTLFFVFSPGIDVWAGWNITYKLQLVMRGRFTFPLLAGPDHNFDKRRINEFSIGFGYKFF